jgi:hypothetical protein
VTSDEGAGKLAGKMKPQTLRCGIAALLLGALLPVLGQNSPYGLIAIKEGASPDGFDRKLTNSRLFIVGPTNQYKAPVLRLIIADKPLVVGRLSLFEGTIIKDVTDAKTIQAFKVLLAADQCSQTAHAQVIDLPITNGPALDMVVAMFNSAPGSTVAIDVVNEDNRSQSKSYIVPRLAIQELRKQYILVKKAK